MCMMSRLVYHYHVYVLSITPLVLCGKTEVRVKLSCNVGPYCSCGQAHYMSNKCNKSSWWCTRKYLGGYNEVIPLKIQKVHGTWCPRWNQSILPNLGVCIYGDGIDYYIVKCIFSKSVYFIQNLHNVQPKPIGCGKSKSSNFIIFITQDDPVTWKWSLTFEGYESRLPPLKQMDLKDWEEKKVMEWW